MENLRRGSVYIIFKILLKISYCLLIKRHFVASNSLYDQAANGMLNRYHA